MARTKIEVTTEDGRFTLAQSDVPQYGGQWYLEVHVNEEGSYVSATLEGDDLLRFAALILEQSRPPRVNNEGRCDCPGWGISCDCDFVKP